MKDFLLKTHNDEGWLPIKCIPDHQLSADTCTLLNRLDNGDALFQFINGELISAEWQDWMEVGQTYKFRWTPNDKI